MAVTPTSERRVPSFPWGFRRSSADSEVPVSLPVPTYPDGVSSRFSGMHPNLSDRPGMGADGPRRMSTEPFRWPLNLSNRAFGNDDGDSSPPSRVGLSRLQSRKLPHPARSRLLLAGRGPARMVRGTSFRAIAVRFVEGPVRRGLTTCRLCACTGAFAWTPALAGIPGRRLTRR